MKLSRRRWLEVAAVFAAAPLLGAAAAATSKGGVIKLVAERFHYTPNEIKVKVGREYVLEISSRDFIHGFNLPDLKKRADLIPGKVAKITVKFDKPGSYDFLCDNFCGDGHEEMAGRFLVAL